MTHVQKTTYTYVVYHTADDPPQDMSHAMREAFDGSMVGQVINERIDDVAPDKLVDELIAIGNDGEFFEEI
jgi:hypothetical protein